MKTLQEIRAGTNPKLFSLLERVQVHRMDKDKIEKALQDKIDTAKIQILFAKERITVSKKALKILEQERKLKP